MVIQMLDTQGRQYMVEAYVREDREEATVLVPGTGQGLKVFPDGSGEIHAPGLTDHGMEVAVIGPVGMIAASVVGMKVWAGAMERLDAVRSGCKGGG